MYGECVQHDSRGTLWIANFSTTATKPCPDNSNPEGNVQTKKTFMIYDLLEMSFAKWKCLDGKFESSEPDRSECVHDWLEEIEDLVM